MILLERIGPDFDSIPKQHRVSLTKTGINISNWPNQQLPYNSWFTLAFYSYPWDSLDGVCNVAK